MNSPPSSSANTPAPTTPATAYDAKAVAIETARLLSDDRCSDVTLLDVRGISSVQDFVILASGTSDRQMRSAAADIKNLLPKLGSSVYRTSIDDQSTWIVVDCVDTVIHIFEPNTRSYYDLESMWGDAPKVEWLRPGQKPFSADDDSDQGDSDEPLPARELVEASEPDADMELTTGSAEAFAQEARASVGSSAAPAKAKASKSKAKPSPKAKVQTKAKVATKVTKKAAAKKAPAPAKKAVAKAAKKPVAKAAAKKAASKPLAKKPAAKKKVAKKKSR